MELQDILSFKNPKYPQKYPHSKNILVDVKTACWTIRRTRRPQLSLTGRARQAERGTIGVEGQSEQLRQIEGRFQHHYRQRLSYPCPVQSAQTLSLPRCNVHQHDGQLPRLLRMDEGQRPCRSHGELRPSGRLVRPLRAGRKHRGGTYAHP